MSKPVGEVNDEIRGILDDMLETMYAAPGIGLAAIQIGIPLRMLVIDISSVSKQDNNKKDPQFFINPIIIDPSDNLSSFEEGCLSFPDEIINVHRPDKIVVKYEDEDKKDHKIKLSGMAARIFLHEFDHLQGIVFTDHK